LLAFWRYFWQRRHPREYLGSSIWPIPPYRHSILLALATITIAQSRVNMAIGIQESGLSRPISTAFLLAFLAIFLARIGIRVNT
jgi:hypothetical protein